MAVALVVASVLALSTVLMTTQPNLAPFQAAANALFDAPAAELATSAGPGGRSLGELRVTPTGEALGTLRVDGEDYDLFRVGGRTFLRSTSGAVPGAAPGGAGGSAFVAEQLRGRWIAVDGIPEIAGPASPPGPAELALFAWSVLEEPDQVQVERAGPPLAGRPTQVARGRLGALYVSRDQPYQVLRVESAGDGAPWCSGSPAGHRTRTSRWAPTAST